MSKNLFLFCLFGLAACQSAPQHQNDENLTFVQEEAPRRVAGAYDLSNPTASYTLPDALDEVSGLDYLHDNKILCLEDENGKIYLYDLEWREVSRTFRFAGDRDFEGVEEHEGTVMALESDGDLYVFPLEASQRNQVERIETALHSGNDTEGLGFDPASGRWLIACKEKDNLQGQKAEKDIRAIYAFDLSTQSLSREPVLRIREGEVGKFKPSGIAVHPKTGAFYVIASSGNSLLVLNERGEVEEQHELPKKLLEQPEGICFAPNGTLFISSEGNPAYILEFAPTD